MWLSITIILLLLFTLFNYLVHDGDYFEPSFIFSFVFFISALFCVLEQKTYAIEFHFETFFILAICLTSFSLSSLLFKTYNQNYHTRKSSIRQLEEIIIPKSYLIILIIIQLLTIYFFSKHILTFSVMYDGKHRSLIQSVDLYDKIFKFHNHVYKKINAPLSPIYRIGDPLSRAGGFLMLYVAVNNYLVKKKIDLLNIVPVLGVCVIIFLRGSRSPLFRVFTMAAFLFYFLGIRYKVISKGSLTILKRVIAVLLLFGCSMILLLPLMGRKSSSESGGVLTYLFIYIGAPLLNLDMFLSGDNVKFMSSVSNNAFGNFTFMGLYSMLNEWFGFENYNPDIAVTFTNSSNGLKTGNVYTHFYKLTYDFGLLGGALVNLIVVLYYTLSYHNLLYSYNKNKRIDFRLFLYSYLFNDLVMSMFSTRFFETVLTTSFLKVMIVAWMFNYLFIEREISIKNFTLSIRKKNKLTDLMIDMINAKK
ncbi:MAG: oligosaccharide repeat unit polymerase [Ruminococcus sp.]|nr:oligosaccharide repeat unit polymerase [Ruminococcus sp.]